MLETMRKHHYVLMLIIAVVVIISFTWWGYYGKQDGAGGYIKKLYGHEYTDSDVRLGGTHFRLAQEAGSPGDLLFSYAQTLLTTGQNQSESLEVNSLVTSVVIREEAKKLGIAVEEEDLKKKVQSLRSFQEDTASGPKFDREKYENFMKLGDNREIREREFYTVLKDALLLEKMRKLIGGAIPASEYQVNLAYNDRHVRTTAKVFEFPKKEFENLKATDEEAQKFYDTSTEKYKALAEGSKEKTRAFAELEEVLKSQESIDASYVKLALSDQTDVSKLKPEEQEAKKKEWKQHDNKVRSTLSQLDDFIKEENKTLAEAAAILKEKPEYKDNPNFLPCEVKTVTGMTKESPVDDFKGEMKLLDAMFLKDKETVQATKSYVTFVVDKHHDRKLLEFADAKAKILEKLTREKVTAAITDKINGVRAKVQEGLAAGKTFDEASKDVGVTPVELVWSPNKPPKNAPSFFGAAQTVARVLNPGTLAAEPTAAGDSLILVYVDKRELPFDPVKGPTDKEQMTKMLGLSEMYGRPSPLFSTWLAQRRDEADPVFVQAQVQ